MTESVLTVAPAPAAQTPAAAAPAPAPARQVDLTSSPQSHAPLLPQAPARFPVYAVPSGRSQLHAQPLLPLQRKLLIGSSADPLEREADDIAESVTGFAPPPRIRGSSPPAVEAPAAVHHVLRSPGQPLDSSTRAWAEPALQSDFRNVRLHTGPQASDSAAAINARAYTVGSSIVLGPGAPTSGPAFRRLMAHELSHVVQQGSAPPRLASPAPRESSAAPGLPAITHRVAAPVVQRDEAVVPDTSGTDLGWFTEGIIDLLSGPARIFGDTAYHLVRATWHGFYAEIKSHSGEIIDKIKSRLKEFATSPSQLAMFFPKYWWGLIKGIFSPITGLFDLAVSAVKLEEVARNALATAWENRAKIASDATDLAVSMRGLGGKAKNAVKSFLAHPIDTITALGPVLDQAKQQANAAAERGGHTIAGKLIQAADQPIPDLAEVGGEVIGTVVVNVALFIFTDGIGDAIVQIAGKLGEVGSWLSRLGKGAAILGRIASELGELLGTVGGWVTRAEALIGKIAGTLLKPLEPVLEEFGGLMGKLRAFLRDLLGVAEKAESQEAAALAKGLSGGKGEPKLPPREPRSQAPPTTKPKVQPPPTEPKAQIPPPQEPKAQLPPPPEPKAPPPQPKPQVDKPPAPVIPDEKLPPPKPAPQEPKTVTPPPDEKLPPPGKVTTPPEAQPKPPATTTPPDEVPPQKFGDADKAPPEKTTAPDEDTPTTAADKEPAKPAPQEKEPTPDEQENAPPDKDNPPPEKDPKAPDEDALAKARADRARRLQEIEDELTANRAQMDKLDKQIKAAEARAKEASDEATSLRQNTPERKTAENRARRNRQSAQDLRDERNALDRRNDQLRSERKFLTAPKTWQDAEDFLREEFNGQKKTFHVNDELGDRNIDCFSPDLASRECKYGGPHDLSDFIEKEIKKDVALRAAGKVSTVEWHFYPDPASGFGPTARLEKALNDAGIKIVFHRF